MEIDKLEENNIEQNQEQEQKRPTFLLVLCILSFISLGFNFIGNFFGLFSGPLSESELEKVMSESLKMVAALQETGNNEISETLELVVNMQGYINGNFYFHSLITLLSVITGFIGVLFMFQGKKNGFHFYIIYNIISILLIYVSVPFNEVPTILIVTNVIFSALFILMYSRNLEWMK